MISFNAADRKICRSIRKLENLALSHRASCVIKNSKPVFRLNCIFDCVFFTSFSACYLNFRNPILEPWPQMMNRVFEAFDDGRVRVPTLLYVRRWKSIEMYKNNAFARHENFSLPSIRGKFCGFPISEINHEFQFCVITPRSSHKMHTAHATKFSLARSSSLFPIYF